MVDKEYLKKLIDQGDILKFQINADRDYYRPSIQKVHAVLVIEMDLPEDYMKLRTDVWSPESVPDRVVCICSAQELLALGHKNDCGQKAK